MVAMMIGLVPEVNRAFSAGAFGVPLVLGRCPRLTVNTAPLALKQLPESVSRAIGESGALTPRQQRSWRRSIELPLIPRANIRFSQSDDRDGYRTLGQYSSAVTSHFRYRHANGLPVRNK